MAYYAYKNVRDAIPDDFRVKYEKEWLEETGHEFEGSADYNGDLWHMTAAYIEHLQSTINSYDQALLAALETAKIGTDPDGYPCFDDCEEETLICDLELDRRKRGSSS
jgi:hypothetical protein